MAAPTVSVIIPFLNPQERFFREAVASVTAQGYRPLELVLANDGSTPHTIALAKRLMAGSGVPARLVEHPGGATRGLSATRNLGASAATGEFLAFLDADDVWLEPKLVEQVEILRSAPDAALVFGQTRYWYSWQENGGTDFVVTRGIERKVTLHPPRFVALFLRGRIIVPSASNTMMRRSAFLACGGFEEAFPGMYEDQAFLVKLGLEHPVIGVPKCWDCYRQHPDSMTAHAGRSGTGTDARRAFLAWAREYCACKAVRDPGVLEALGKETWLVADPRHASRRLKKAWLRCEESLFPASLRKRIWCR